MIKLLGAGLAAGVGGRFLAACSSDDGGGTAASTTSTTAVASTTTGSTAPAAPVSLGPLGDVDENGLRLPEGFTSRIVATSGQPVADTGYTWHTSPDGGAT